ncbi:MAG: RNA polymerase sigma factor [Patescibacteria group bacterium]|nr:RNA polymerase sigma factor [Patescibacteria group bacterium]
MKTENSSDELLVLFVQKNSGKGFEYLVDRYQEKIFNYAKRIVSDPDLAEDITQESFIAAYSNINSFDPKRKFSSWLYRIAHNKAINEIRKRKKIIFLDEKIPIESDENSKKITNEIDRKKAKILLEKKLDIIPIKYKETLTLRYFENLSYEEISDILKIPVSTVGIRIKRGLEKLKKITNISPEDYL